MTALQTLIVDDSPSARIMLKNLLEQQGAQVDQSTSGAQALSYLESNTPDVIFMDHTMPGMSGLDAVLALRNNPNTANIPVIMYTCHTDPEYRQKALACGAREVLPKPATRHNISYALSHLHSDPFEPKNCDNVMENIKEQLPQVVENQLDKLKSDLQRDIQQLVNQHLSHSNNSHSLTSLIHSVTDSKIHQLNLELRQQMTSKLDVLLQDIQDDHRALKNDILLQVEQRLSSHKPFRANSWPQSINWMGNWHLLIALTIALGLLFSWPN